MSQHTTPEPKDDAEPTASAELKDDAEAAGGAEGTDDAEAAEAPEGDAPEQGQDDADATEGEAAAGEPSETGPPAAPAASIGVVSFADAQNHTSADSLAALSTGPIAPAAMPPVPSQPPSPPGPRAVPHLGPQTVPQPSADWLASHPLVTSGPESLRPDPTDAVSASAAGQDVPAAGPAEPEEPTASAQPPASERRSRSEGPELPASLTSDRLVAMTSAPPVGGWRRLVYYATLGYVNLGDSDAVRFQRALEHRIAMRLGERTRYVPVLSRKGGVGKTTVTTLLGMALADLREDRVIAMDANPDRGTLSDRNPGRATHTARQLVKDRFDVTSFAQLSSYTAREGSRLDVLASDADPMVAHAFNDADYRAVTDVLGRYYSIVLTDSGTGMVHSVMQGTLEKADAVVLVSGGSVDEARLASETLSWLEAHDRGDLVKKAIVVINMSAGGGTRVDVDAIEDHFRTRVQHVVRIPHDRHLAEGSQIDFRKLRPATREAAVELAALVVDQLAGE